MDKSKSRNRFYRTQVNSMNLAAGFCPAKSAKESKIIEEVLVSFPYSEFNRN